MKINFRQGIVTYEQSTGGQAFLQVPVAGTVNIIGDVTVAFAHRDANYLHTHVDPVTPAWTGLPTSGDVWIYWDIDVKTAAVTYGYTQVQPQTGSTQPGTLVNDLHWFDTVNFIMKVYETNRFQERIRVFAARLNGTQLFPMGSNTATPYAGTQVGINTIAFAGQILFASSLPVIVNTSNSFSPPAFGRAYTFATTETEFVTSSAQKVNTIRLESDFTTAPAAQALAAYDVVKYNAAGRLEPAGYNDTSTTVVGIITDDVSINSLATVVLQGVVTNEQWNWPTVGAELFILNDGELTDRDPNLATPSLYPDSKPPVARVLNSKEIIFMQGLGKVGPRGLNPETIDTIGDVTILDAEERQVLQYIGSPLLWRNNFALLDDLGDVSIPSTPSLGDVLTYFGSPAIWTNVAGTSNTLVALTDTTIGSPITTNQVLQFNGTAWVNATLDTGPTTFEALTDTAVGSPVTDDFVQYNGSVWVNRDRRTANVGYFGVTPVLRAGSPQLFQRSDAGRGIISIGSPASPGSPALTTNTWVLTNGPFNLGDVITLNRRPNERRVAIQVSNNVQILSAFDTNSISFGSPTVSAFLGNGSQATLWLIQQTGSPETDVWMLNGTNITFG